MRVAERLRAIVDPLPEGSAVTLPTDTLRAWLADEGVCAIAHIPPQPGADASWRTRLWSCPDSTRLGVRELAEALDRGPDWVYRAVSAENAAKRGRDPLPCKRLDGSLHFEAGAVRRWLKASESIVNPDMSPA